jgi:predicted nucleic acid-binding protein
VTRYLVDTGPLVAFLNKRDLNHQWTVSQFAQVQAPLLTCEAVLSEAFFLLRKHSAATEALIELVNRQVIAIPFHLNEEFWRVARLLQRYSDIQVSLADACLVRMTEVYSDSRLFTFDADFQIYRRNGRQVIPVISPS